MYRYSHDTNYSLQHMGFGDKLMQVVNQHNAAYKISKPDSKAKIM